MCIRDRVIAAELFNTAIEKLVDLVSPQQHPVAGQVKEKSIPNWRAMLTPSFFL